MGCGVGNFIYPVLRDHPKLFMHACDFSKRAIEFVKVILILIKIKLLY